MTTDLITARDRPYLDRAFELAERGRGFVHPNPVVGCVLVRDEEVVGEGHHAELGGAHAEVNALAAAGERARGATAYVSLEPCNHRGKTPPCTWALRDAGVERVVFGASDPGPGAGGAEALRSWGIEAVGPVDGEAGRRTNPAFFHVHETGTPYVALKLAVSLDGKIAEAPGRRSQLTGPESMRRVHRLRREFDAIMVGSGTARVDDPLLTVRDGRPVARPPARVVLDSQATVRPDARLFEQPEGAPVIVFTAPDAPESAARALEAAGASVLAVPKAEEGLALQPVLDALWQRGVRAVLCEGGGRLASALLREHLLQRIYLFLARRVIGPRGVPAFGEPKGPDWQGWTAVHSSETLGEDALIVFDRER